MGRPTLTGNEMLCAETFTCRKSARLCFYLPVTMKVEEMREQIQAHIEAAKIKIPA